MSSIRSIARVSPRRIRAPTCVLRAIREPEVAPDGCEALYILVHTPYLRPHHNWKSMLPKYREVILDKLERTAGMDGIRGAIVTKLH